MTRPEPGYRPQPGDVVAVGRAASVQFDNGCGFNFRIIRVTPSTHHDGWAWLDGYQLGPRGDAVARRSIYVQPGGLHPQGSGGTAVSTPPARAGRRSR